VIDFFQPGPYDAQRLLLDGIQAYRKARDAGLVATIVLP
jgi:hypothetical protein